MAGIRAYSFVVAFLTFGFFFLGLTEEGFSGFSTEVDCCQLEGQCIDTTDEQFICIVDDVVENAFCDQETNLCTLLPSNIPTLSEWGLIAMAGILGIAGFIMIRRKRLAA
ncbi:MAG: IPTL-CTERM sorting domain-containing protein [Thermodesulfobacteriota bacterium]